MGPHRPDWGSGLKGWREVLVAAAWNGSGIAALEASTGCLDPPPIGRASYRLGRRKQRADDGENRCQFSNPDRDT